MRLCSLREVSFSKIRNTDAVIVRKFRENGTLGQVRRCSQCNSVLELPLELRTSSIAH